MGWFTRQPMAVAESPTSARTRHRARLDLDVLRPVATHIEEWHYREGKLRKVGVKVYYPAHLLDLWIYHCPEAVELERSMNNAPFELFKEEEFKIVRYAIDPASNSKDPDLKRIFKKKEVRDDSHVLRE